MRMTKIQILQMNRRALKQELQLAVSGGWLTMRDACKLLIHSRGWPNYDRTIRLMPRWRLKDEADAIAE